MNAEIKGRSPLANAMRLQQKVSNKEELTFAERNILNIQNRKKEKLHKRRTKFEQSSQIRKHNPQKK